VLGITRLRCLTLVSEFLPILLAKLSIGISIEGVSPPSTISSLLSVLSSSGPSGILSPGLSGVSPSGISGSSLTSYLYTGLLLGPTEE